MRSLIRRLAEAELTGVRLSSLGVAAIARVTTVDLIAAERAFGDNENEKLLRRVLIRGYIEPAPSHEQAAIDLSLSRAAYFRRLRAAAERVAEYLAQHGGGAS